MDEVDIKYDSILHQLMELAVLSISISRGIDHGDGSIRQLIINFNQYKYLVNEDIMTWIEYLNLSKKYGSGTQSLYRNKYPIRCNDILFVYPGACEYLSDLNDINSIDELVTFLNDNYARPIGDIRSQVVELKKFPLTSMINSGYLVDMMAKICILRIKMNELISKILDQYPMKCQMGTRISISNIIGIDIDIITYS